MKQALYLNGVFESVLQEIVEAQDKKPGITCYLQPYSPKQIRLLVDSQPNEATPVTLYISLTDSLQVVSYRAKVIGWEDKQKLPANRLKLLNNHISSYQPNEHDVYLTRNGQPCVNLIAVTDLERLVSPIPVTSFIKAGNHLPLQVRTRSGGWGICGRAARMVRCTSDSCRGAS